MTDYHLVTGSRDCSVALWDVRDSHEGGDAVADGLRSYMVYEDDEPRHNKDFSSRVRDIKYCSDIRLVAALSTDGSIKLLDPGRNLCKVRGVRGVTRCNTGIMFRVFFYCVVLYLYFISSCYFSLITLFLKQNYY